MIAPVRLRPADLARRAGAGLRTRKLRAALSALGTNLLTVSYSNDIPSSTAPSVLPTTAPGMISRLAGVAQVQDTGEVSGVDAYRSSLIPAINTNGLTVCATSLGLPAASGTSVAQVSFLNAATAREPVAVLGAGAAQLLGIDRVWSGERIWVGGTWFYVAGILRPDTLAPNIDASVLIGYPAAQPSAALSAAADARGAFNGLFLGLGAVGGAVGVADGVLATATYADVKGWAVVVPLEAWARGFGAAVLIGAIAGLLPALKAARMAPAQAL